jgi:carboxylesterase type B
VSRNSDGLLAITEDEVGPAGDAHAPYIAIANFVNYGDPNGGDLPNWPKFDLARSGLLSFTPGEMAPERPRGPDQLQFGQLALTARSWADFRARMQCSATVELA